LLFECSIVGSCLGARLGIGLGACEIGWVGVEADDLPRICLASRLLARLG
jgi:hypothetical protein